MCLDACSRPYAIQRGEGRSRQAWNKEYGRSILSGTVGGKTRFELRPDAGKIGHLRAQGVEQQNKRKQMRGILFCGGA